MEYELSDRARSILIGVLTAVICAIAIYPYFLHLTR